MRLFVKSPLASLEPKAAGGLVIEGGRIVELVEAGGVPSQKVDQIFDASRHVVLPGLINTHHHFIRHSRARIRPQSTRNCFPGSKRFIRFGHGLIRIGFASPCASR